MESTIKTEVEINTTKLWYCHGCLSQDRRLKPLSGEIYKLYYSLLGSGMLYGSEERMICWECEAMLRRVRKFQNQILQAQTELLELFYNMSPKLETLSDLSISTKHHYDQNFEYTEQNNEYIIPETIPDSQPISELPLIKSCSVKIEKLKLEPETSQHSDYYDDDFFESNDFENINESEIDQNIVEPMKKPNKKYKKKIKSSNRKQYLKYATVRNSNIDFEAFNTYFVEELLDYEQIEELIVKPDQNLNCSKWNKCVECDIFFRNPNLLLMHKNLKHFMPGSSITCLLCKVKLPNLEMLRKHWSSHCSFYRCTLCSSYCKKTGRLYHLNSCHMNVYSCNKCTGEFTSKKQFKVHYKELHDTFVCDHCGRNCRGRDMMIKHLPIHAEKQSCKICNKTYKHRRTLMFHIKLNHTETVNKKADKEAAYCVECDQQFRTVNLYKMHVALTARHNPVRQTYPCKECSKIFKKKFYLKSHVHQVHMTEKARFKCSICNKIFSTKQSLQLHIESVHLKLPKKKDKFCDICGRGFSVMRTLENHRRTHTGEKPYKCMHCSVAFAQQYPCVLHMRKVHNDMNTYTKASLLNGNTK